MPPPLQWPSDGVFAGVALAAYGITILVLVLRSLGRRQPIADFAPQAVLWHLVIWCFLAFYLFPYYDARQALDAHHYHTDGLLCAELIRNGMWGWIQWGVGSAAVPIITGILYVPFGGDAYGVLFLASAVGLWAALLFCQAVLPWADMSTARKYAAIVLFLPSFSTWISLFGKDSLVALGLGLASYGYSWLLKYRSSRSLVHLALGLAIIAIVRPHIALICGFSMGFSYFWYMAPSGGFFSVRNIIAGIASIGMVAALFFVTKSYINLPELSAQSATDFQRTMASRNDIGGSSVGIADTGSGFKGLLLAFPEGVVTVLFRPFPWEAHNANAILAALENLLIAWLFLLYGLQAKYIFRRIFKEPYFLYCLLLTGCLLFMLSPIPNLGLISRQRAQLIPFLFVLLVCATSSRKREERPIFDRYASPSREPALLNR